MKRIVLPLASAIVALVLAAPGGTHLGPTLIIRHQARGCHAWGFADGDGVYRASQSVTLPRGSDITIGNNDVMPHRLVQLAGPPLRLGAGAMLNSVGEAIEITFRKAGVYRFTTKPGEDYAKHVETRGEDRVLRLTVTVR
jgi:hypothetical protein